MNNSDFLDVVRRALGGTATQRAAELALAAVTRAIRDGLREDGVVRLAGFGSWRLQKQARRRLLLPRNQAEMILPERTVIRFIPSPTPQCPDKRPPAAS
ncbi:MAG: HU family DNA-binding protein [Akkermansia sp.]|nr:HU family DNA-binding protein [Akkermansia sp.]